MSTFRTGSSSTLSAGLLLLEREQPSLATIDVCVPDFPACGCSRAEEEEERCCALAFKESASCRFLDMHLATFGRVAPRRSMARGGLCETEKEGVRVSVSETEEKMLMRGPGGVVLTGRGVLPWSLRLEMLCAPKTATFLPACSTEAGYTLRAPSAICLLKPNEQVTTRKWVELKLRAFSRGTFSKRTRTKKKLKSRIYEVFVLFVKLLQFCNSLRVVS
ncbi:hypothetical protein L7F22_057414 [Adiantum nelumboides]|nr:hypothetical protein [Adiantum nelumboides]